MAVPRVKVVPAVGPWRPQAVDVAVSLSVIIPVRNEAARLPRLLQQLRPLLEGGDEVIVVDGGSSDESLSIARSAGVLCLQGVSGRARQMNLGAAHARGQWLWFLHADSVLLAPLEAYRQAIVSVQEP